MEWSENNHFGSSTPNPGSLSHRVFCRCYCCDDGVPAAVRAKIIGSQEIHVKRGSTISLSCSVNMHASSIAWYVLILLLRTSHRRRVVRSLAGNTPPEESYRRVNDMFPIIFSLLYPPPSRRYHGSSIVDFDSVRGGISLETEKTETGTTSRLLLTRATLRDSGNYSCVPVGAISASIQVHVLNGTYNIMF